MDELFAYALYKNVLKASSVMEGRFVVLDGPVDDMSTANFGKIVKDKLDGLFINKKYPAAVMLPPVNVHVNPLKDGWEVMKNNIFFLTLDGKDGSGVVKGFNSALNISEHTPSMDWKDMKECASQFIMMLDKTISSNKTVLSQFRLRSDQQIVYSRCSLETSERLNGVKVSFDTMTYKTCTVTDYDLEAVIEIPEFIQHPIHNH